MRGVVASAAAALAVVLSACGSIGAAPAVGPRGELHGLGVLVFVARGPSHGLGVDNTDLVAVAPNGSVRDLTSSPAAETNAAWSADGSRVVFARQSTTGRENGAIALNAGLYVWSPGRGKPRRIATCPGGACTQGEFAWSPNDRQIAFVSDANAYGVAAVEVMNADGSGLHTVCDHERCGYGLASPRWSPDSRKLVFSNAGGLDTEQFGGSRPSRIWIANADGSGG